jgi:predicted MPP superfamily phosphohydrolase
MPITLPQLSRREFLKRAALAGAATALAPSSYAGLFGKSRDKHTFAFFSDTHIAADAATVQRGVNMADNLAACVRELTMWRVKPAAVIVNGDLAMKAGLPDDYATFGKLLEPVRALAPVHLNLGNHDQREHFWKALPQDAADTKSVPQKQTATIESDRANWFLLDSLAGTDVGNGQLGASQLTWLDWELGARSEKPAIIVGHHNLKSAIFTSGLDDSSALAELFVKHRHIKAFIFGHTHDWHVEEHSSGVQLINLSPTGYVFKDGKPSGWVRCTLARDGAEFELRALDQKHPEHAQIKKLTWRTT